MCGITFQLIVYMLVVLICSTASGERSMVASGSRGTAGGVVAGGSRGTVIGERRVVAGGSRGTASGER